MSSDHHCDPAGLRANIRAGRYRGPTTGLATGHLQANVVILPADWAGEFEEFCRRNPKPCPLIAVGEPGVPTLSSLGRDIDIRTDVPCYRVFRHGALVDEPVDITRLWRDDLVVFVIGCSFTFEFALLRAGIPLRHILSGRNVAMYRTSIACEPAGRFTGRMVVSMRPVARDALSRVREISARYPHAHGSPLHEGDPAAIGIADLARPDFGDPIEILPDEVPVFWACGVTPQAILEGARPPFCVTHAPGCMLVTDLPESLPAGGFPYV